MRLNIPLDFPNFTFTDQLKWLETWACLPSGTLFNAAAKLAGVANEDSEKMVPMIKGCVNEQLWPWPAYDAYIQDDGFQYSRDRLTDMAEQIYQKYRTNKMAHYRKSQMEPIKHLNPYWELSGRCASKSGDDQTASLILNANDAFWDDHCIPWRCENLDCKCSVFAITEYTMRKEANHL